MPLLDSHRRAAGKELEIFLLQPPFSFFDFIESRFGDVDSIRRIFSLARSSSTNSLLVEHIDPCGIIAEENEDILARWPDYSTPELLRVSFWRDQVTGTDLGDLASKGLVGYAIFKRDVIRSKPLDAWHVFESVFVKYPHEHNCVPRPGTYRLTVGGCGLEIKGLLYCQQNGLNKACAQVALRSLLSRNLPEGDISYRHINQIAAPADPGKGLNVQQMRKIFTVLGVGFSDVDYCQDDAAPTLRQDLQYQKYAYSGLEAGSGSLVGFRLAGRELRGEARHIIPFYGHTFNKDTWAPNADISYFRIGEGVGYVPSESWTSSFIGHDDNFGPNFCIPRLYMEKDKVDYVVEIFRPGVCYGGVQAEALALNILYSIFPSLGEADNKWISRLIEWTEKQQVVFRAQALTSSEYVQHLRSARGWEGESENPELCKLLEQGLPTFVWAVEISTPQLFPANERKLGEIVFDASRPLDVEDDAATFDLFLLARLPGIYLLGGDITNGTPRFTPVPSGIRSHTDLIRQ